MQFRIYIVQLLVIMLAACDLQNYNEEHELSTELDSLTNLFFSGKVQESLHLTKDFVSKNPKLDYVHSFLGTIYLSLGRDSLAKVSTKKALSLNPINYAANTNYGILLDKKGKHEKAYKYYLKAIDTKKDFPQAYSNLMGNRVHVADYKTAKIYGEKSVKLADNIGDKAVLCFIYHKLNMFERRDSLYAILKAKGYSNMSQLEEIIRE